MGIRGKTGKCQENTMASRRFTDEEVNKIVDRALGKGRRMREKIQKEQVQAGNGGVLR
ncbi:MAG: hypothetical protein ACLUD2_15505 [Clostridium sp.]